MKFTVTALGAQAGGEAGAAKRITDYLMGKAPDQNRPMVGVFDQPQPGRGMGSYYQTDQLEGDGWWSGAGSQRLGLEGAVQGPVLESLLSGRHHQTGERLISAKGSTGRQTLKMGEYSRLVEGVKVWSLSDAASRFDTNLDDALKAASHLDAGLFVVDPDGARWLTAEGVSSLADVLGLEEPEPHSDVLDRLKRSDGHHRLTVTEASALTGISGQHFRKIVKEWETNRAEIEAGIAGRALPYQRAWLPAEKQAGHWSIRRSDLIDYWERRRPPAVRQAYDVVGTVEKSVSILTLLSDQETKERCLDSIVAANQRGMDWLDQQASRGRRKGSSVGSEGFVWASFMHATSRNLDPHPHIHNVVLNFIEDPFGARRAVDARFLYVEARAASALATGQLRWELQQRFPNLRWIQHRKNGTWEIDGISQELIKEFSTRRSEIEEVAKRLVKDDGSLPTRSELQEISKNTRRKKEVVDAAEILDGWLARAEEVGFDPAVVVGHDAPLAYGPMPELTDAEQVQLFEFLATSDEGVCQEESTFNRGDVLAAINRWTHDGQPRALPAETMITLANDFLSTHLAIPVEHHGNLIQRRDGRTVGTIMKEDRWTTPDMVRTQLRILYLWGGGVGEKHLARVDTAAIARVGAEEGLGAEQVKLIAEWTRSGDQFQAAIGQPGAGKTFTMRAAKKIWEEAGYRVLGAAVKGTAAQHLGRETGIPSETVAHYLSAASVGIQEFDENTVLVVDEATTLADRDLRYLMHICSEAGATLRMIGDPAQQQSVAAGGMWEHLVELYCSRTPELSEQRRLLDPAEIETARLLREGQIEEAFNSLLANGNIIQADDPTEGEMLALAGWLDRAHRGVHAPMIDRRNIARERLNLIAQAIRVRAGEVTDLHSFGDRDFGIGDRIVATQPNRRLFPDGGPTNYLSNGSTGTVTGASPAELTVWFEGLGEIIVPAATVRSHVDLGYAVTAFSVQGLTVDEAESTARPGEEIHSLYVMLTRGRHSNTLITARPLPGEAHGVADSPDQLPVVEVAESIADSKLAPALVVDPALEQLAELDSHCGLKRPTAAPEVEARAAQAELDRAVRHALNHPPASFTEQFPHRPTAPWLAKKWDATLAAVAIYVHSWAPMTVSSSTGWEGVIGVEPTPGSEQHGEWAILKNLIVKNAISLASRELTDSGVRSLTMDDPTVDGVGSGELNKLHSPTVQTDSEWLTALLRHHATKGTLGPTVDYQALAAWATAVAAHHRQMPAGDGDGREPILAPNGDQGWELLLREGPLAIPALDRQAEIVR